jgi:hypothetical protein
MDIFPQDKFKKKTFEIKNKNIQIPKPGHKIHGNEVKNFSPSKSLMKWIDKECVIKLLNYINNPNLKVNFDTDKKVEHIKEWYLKKNKEKIELVEDEPNITIPKDSEQVEECNEKKNLNFEIEDIMIFLSTILSMMLQPCHEIEDYFSNSIFYGNKMVKSLWNNRNSFLKMWKSFRGNPFWFNYHFNKINKKVWNPHKWNTIDETLSRFEGKFKYKQHVKGKPHDTGIKFYMISDSSYFTYNSWFYNGHQPKVAIIVKDFIKQLPGDGYHICGDSYFGGYETACNLISSNCRFLFTQTPNRLGKICKEKLKIDQLKKGDWRTISNDYWIFMAYKDKKLICFESDLFDSKTEGRKGNGINSLVKLYEMEHVNVDVFDRKVSLYNFNHRFYKWTTSTLLTIFRMIFINSYILYKNVTGNELSIKIFYERLAIELSHIGGKSIVPRPIKNIKLHSPKKYIGKKRSKCSYCYNNYSSYYCTKCKRCVCDKHKNVPCGNHQ